MKDIDVCGISSILALSIIHKGDLKNAMARMVGAQEHRGPDFSAHWIHNNIALGHNRLRVIDLDPRSDQPFPSKVSNPEIPRLVYNGEIYNYKNLRKELYEDGIRFETQGDTEVLYASLLHWGLHALTRLHGMFAFSFWDPRKQELWIGRDRMGIKPIYIAKTSRAFVVASEIKGLLASGMVEHQFDPSSIYQVSRFNHLLGKKTSFCNVVALEPGEVCRLAVTTANLHRHKYWELEFRPTDIRSFKKRTSDLNNKFEEAVASHLVADLPVSSYMSGGIDSTALASEAHKAIGKNLTTYSMIFPGVPYNEEDTIVRLLEKLPVRNKKVPIEGITFSEYEHYIVHAEMPQLWTTDLALERLAFGVRESGHRVVLSGEGPDELLAGYDGFRWMKLRNTLERAKIMGGLSRLPHRFKLPGGFSWFDLEFSMIRFYVDGHRQAGADNIRETYGFYPENIATWGLLHNYVSDVFDDDWKGEFPIYKNEEEDYFKNVLAPKLAPYSHLHQNLYFELAVRLPNWVLLMADRMSSAHGVELRVPYLDDGFVDVALSLPETDRLRGMNEKYILKQMHRSRVPDFIRKRHKQPLYTPIAEWVRSFPDDSRFEKYWSPEVFRKHRYFKFEKAEKLKDAIVNDRYESMLQRLAVEWMFLLVLSSHVLAEVSKEWVDAPSLIHRPS